MSQPWSDPERTLQAVGLSAAADQWRGDWPASQESYTPGRIFFLEPGYVRGACRTLRIAADIEEALVAALDLFRVHPALERVAWHGHVLLGRGIHPGSWPMLPKELHERAPLFYALVTLSCLPALQQQHRARGIPESITMDTLSDFELWVRDYQGKHGHLGFGQKGWLSNHFSGKLYKLGRLQFEFSTMKFDFHAYRNRRDRRVVVLAGHGMRFRSDGQFDGTNDLTDPAGAWTAEYTVTESAAHGHPISVRGAAQRAIVELGAAEWRRIYGLGDPALSVHIPATGPMEHEACGASFRQAASFFPRHFPEQGARAFRCTSWLLDSQLEDCLPPSSNIVRFLREWYLLPLPKASDAQTYERVFGGRIDDIERAPQQSSLQRAIVKHVRAGGRWRDAGSLLFLEDLNWGAQVYRKTTNDE